MTLEASVLGQYCCRYFLYMYCSYQLRGYLMIVFRLNHTPDYSLIPLSSNQWLKKAELDAFFKITNKLLFLFKIRQDTTVTTQ